MKTLLLAFLVLLGVVTGFLSADVRIVRPSPFATSCNPTVDCNTNGVGAMVPDPLDCHNFYFCLDGSVPSDAPIPCPSDQFFNSDTLSCEAETSPCVNPCDNCTVTCSGCCFQIPDPLDCRRFYVCTGAGTPNETYHLSCGSNEIFDSSSAMCVNGTDCTSTCTDTGGSDCADTYDCSEGNGNFPRCTTCDASYFTCLNGVATINYCTANTVFNTNPEYPYCILPENCPFPS